MFLECTCSLLLDILKNKTTSKSILHGWWSSMFICIYFYVYTYLVIISDSVYVEGTEWVVVA